MDKIAQIRQILKSDATSEEEYKMAVRELMTNGNYGDFDESYLAALFFPEYSIAVRVPTPFGIPTTLVTQKFSFYVNVGAGDGYISFLPQDQSSWCIHRSMSGFSSNQPNYPQWTGKNTTLHCVIPVNESQNFYLQDAFQQMRVVGASMRVAYTGSVDAEQGFLVASHVYDKRVCELSDKAVEDGYYVTRCRPSDGIRLVYQPKDDRDFEYVDNDKRFSFGNRASPIVETFSAPGAVNETVAVSVLDPSSILLGGTVSRDQLDESQDYTYYVWKLAQGITDNYASPVSNILGWQPIVSSDQAQQLPIEAMWGMGPRIGSQSCPQQLVCTYKGLPLGQECLRVDVVRHLECVPRTALKDLVATARPFHSEESLKQASKIGPQVPQMHSSTLRVADHVQNHVMSEVASGGKAATLGARIKNRLGGFKGVALKVGQFAVDAGATALLGPEAGIAAQALMSGMKKTMQNQGGNGGPSNGYTGNPSASSNKFITDL